MVEIVIKMPKYYLTHPQDYTCLAECVRRGTPLPKGHGRIGDLDALSHKMCMADIDFLKGKSEEVASLMLWFCDKAPTIIEAESEE